MICLKKASGVLLIVGLLGMTSVKAQCDEGVDPKFGIHMDELVEALSTNQVPFQVNYEGDSLFIVGYFDTRRVGVAYAGDTDTGIIGSRLDHSPDLNWWNTTMTRIRECWEYRDGTYWLEDKVWVEIHTNRDSTNNWLHFQHIDY